MLIPIMLILGLAVLIAISQRHRAPKRMRLPYLLGSGSLICLFGASVAFYAAWVLDFSLAAYLMIALSCLSLGLAIVALFWAGAKSRNPRRNISIIAAIILISFGFYVYQQYQQKVWLDRFNADQQRTCVPGRC